jgi:hypothetical protein
MLDIKIDTSNSSEFNDDDHFYFCLIDLLEEWNETVEPKEMATNDAGFDSDRFTELMEILHRKVGLKWAIE